ncbi:hypothetical protein [Streptomyces sp. NPDC056013]|uniref:hypothetical protein n=1 Tax=Streptomyces sp. NPDC056013 TaxID=3345680 RepID=UPI0035D52E9F
MRHRFLAAVAVLVTATACAVPPVQEGDAKPSAAASREAAAPGGGPSSAPADPVPEPTTADPRPEATTAGPLPEPTASPTPVTPRLTAVTVDDWRYGYAWRGFATDVEGAGGQYDKPGEVHVTLTVQMTVTDDRRPEIPAPNSLWVGHNYGFTFFVKPSKFADCLPLEGVGLCELSSGPFYSGCEELRNDGDGTDFPQRGSLIMSCRIDAAFPESVRASDFTVGVRYDECCDSDARHRVWLPFQDLPAAPPVTEDSQEEQEETEEREETVEPETGHTPPPIRYL